MRKKANLYILRVLAQRVIGILLFLFGAGWALSVRSMTYFAMYLVFAVVAMALVHSASPETLAARGRIATNSPVWDKVILGLYWILAYFAIYLIAGLEASAAPSSAGWIFGVGIALQVLAFLLSLWAVRVNPFLESTSRVQKDRCQSVCSCGPYSTIRHPTYAAILIWCVGVSMVFETKYTAITALVIAVITVIRTALEDRMLIKDLLGYEDYAKQVRFRLIPYIW
ncbi:MAG: isoprenylcysteine carboxylmethyltransferase family protein [Clostridiales bacterium]|nr:isoprenylcysteine carboxylmethyltransferase family protein [Clostridiales bacterium]